MIALTEVTNFLTLLTHPVFKSLNSIQKVLYICLFPLVPCFLQIKLAWLRFKEAQVIETMKEKLSIFIGKTVMELESSLAGIRSGRIKVEDLTVDLKVNESIFECYPLIQLVTCLYLVEKLLSVEYPNLVYDEISNQIVWAIVPSYLGLLLAHINFTQSDTPN